MSAGTRSVAMVTIAVVGAFISASVGLESVYTSTAYSLFVTALLGFGLYAATTGISLDLIRTQLRTVVLAVTLGVVAKAALIFLVMLLVFREPQYIILAIAVAQIDPLSVTAIQAKSRMSESGKALLTAWAAFDDPVTVLLTVYVTAFVLSVNNDPAAGLVFGANLGYFALGLVLNAVLVGVVLLVYRIVGARRKRRANNRPPSAREVTLLVVALAAVALVAISLSLLLALAFIGLFLRPPAHWRLDRLVLFALLLASLAVGLLLAGGVSIVEGVVLGAAAYLAQIVVAAVLVPKRSGRGDRARLALAQQNGLTAIVLGLTLEQTFPGSVAIIAPAIVTVNVLHAVCNAVLDRLAPEPKPPPELRPASVSVSPPAPASDQVAVPSPTAVTHLPARPAQAHAEPSG